MKLLNVALMPWAGSSSRSVQFKPGLNVLLGNNDVGKSSLFSAIDRALFVPARLGKLALQKELASFIPIGGDHARVELQLQGESGERFTLLKSWGARVEARLTLEQGTPLVDEERIQEKLAALFPLAQGTCRTLLLSRQTTLHQTLEELREQPEALRSLGDLLQRAVLQTDGVSVETLKVRLEALRKDHFDHWDLTAGRPEGGRGIQNPWKKEVGHVLRAYYARELLAEKLKVAAQSESRLDQLQGELKHAESEAAKAAEFVLLHKDAVRALQLRRELKARIETATQAARTLGDDFTAWSTLELSLPSLRSEIQSLGEQAQRLQAEAQEAARERENLALRERFERARIRKQESDSILAKGQATRKLPKDEFDRILQAHTLRERLLASLSAGKLRVRIASLSPRSLTVARDLDPETVSQVLPDQALQLSASGRIRIQGAELEIRIESGEGDFAGVERRYQEAGQALQALLQAHNLTDVDHAQRTSAEYEKTREEYRSAQRALQELLGGEAYEALEARVRALGDVRTARPQESILADLNQAQSQLGAKRRGLEDAERQLEGLKQRHSIQDKALLLQKLAQRSAEQSGLETELKALPPLPEGMGDEGTFLRTYTELEKKKDSLSAEKNRLILAIAELARVAPDQSVQELEPELRDAEDEFKRALSKGRAILKVQDTASRITQGAVPDTFSELRRSFEERFSRLTGRKYEAARLESGLPSELKRRDGIQVPFLSLSSGMRDAAALCLKLSMAEHLLQGKQALMLLDDPLVNLDPERTRQAVAMIQEFSERCQVLLFTCNPASAEALGGNLIPIAE